MSAARKKVALQKDAPKKIALALQGGGSHGAFTWGVLDALLADERIEIEALSGTSAGAMNAIALVDGYEEGGRDGARSQLARFWRAISSDGSLSAVQREVIGRMMAFGGGALGGGVLGGAVPGGGASLYGLGNPWLSWLTSMSSPYSFNPLDLNPLRDVLEREIDFARVRACPRFNVFVAATNVWTGKIRIFDRASLSADHVLASACLPTVFRAVEIDGEPYWDGGYMGNPALYPLFDGATTSDILLVQLNPVERRETPRTARQIEDRLNEITFNSSLLRELRAIDFAARLIDEGTLTDPNYKRVRMHRIGADAVLKDYGASTKLDSHFDFLQTLQAAGQKAGQAWLVQHFDDLGVRGTLDIRAEIG